MYKLIKINISINMDTKVIFITLHAMERSIAVSLEQAL